MDQVATLTTLVEDLKRSPTASEALDLRVESFLNDGHAAVPGAPYTSSTDAAMLLVPVGWWWHLSHLEARVIPTSPWPGMPVSDSMDYHFDGRPLAYACMYFGVRERMAIAVCIAALRARLGLLVKAKAKAEGRMYLVDTGNGSRIANVDGKLLDMPDGSWLTEDGKLIARKEAFPEYVFLEPEDEDRG